MQHAGMWAQKITPQTPKMPQIGSGSLFSTKHIKEIKSQQPTII